MLKFLLYILIIWFLVRFISRLFLPNARKNRSRRVDFSQFTNMFEHMNQGGGGNSSSSSTGNNKHKNLEEIEEAEYEDITDDETEKK